MKNLVRKLCVFLLAVVLFGKSLYGDIQYALADEYTSSDVTVTGEESEDIVGDEPAVPPEEEPDEEDPAPDVSGGDVSGGDISGGDISGSDISGDDAFEGDVSGGDAGSEEDPTPVISVETNKNTDITVLFFVLKSGYLESISPEQNGSDVTSNGQKRYEAAYVFEDAEGHGLEYVKDNYSFDNVEQIYDLMHKGVVKHLALPSEYGEYESISEKFGIDKAYGESGKETLVEDLIGNNDYLASLVVFFKEKTVDDLDTKNVVYATGDMIDWYVLKHSDTNAWHADGFMSQAKVLIDDENIPVGRETVYTYDATSKVSEEAAIVNSVIDTADDELPGNYVIKNVLYLDANGNAVSEMVNVGKYKAVATVSYVYEGSNDEFSYFSDDIEVIFPVTINKRTVTVTANNNSKYVGQTDPILTGRIEGAVAADPVSATFWRISGNEAVGTYPIYSTVVASANYKVITNDGSFTIYAASTVDPTPTPSEPTPPTPAPEEEFPGVVPLLPEPTDIPVPSPVIADDTVEVEEEVIPLADSLETEETVDDSETLDVGDVYPQLRDLTIEDEETPLAAPGECWIHWLIVLLILVDVLYTVIQVFRNSAVIKKLKNGKE